MSPKPLILGLGNGMCGDDAVGPVVAREIARTFGDVIDIAFSTAPLLDLAVSRTRGGLVVVIDAAEETPQLELGRWRKIVYPREAKLLAESRLRDTHTFSVESLMRFREALGRRLPRVWIYALAGRRFRLGDTPSAAVLRAVPALVRRIETDIRQWLGLEPFSSYQRSIDPAPLTPNPSLITHNH